MSCEVGGIVPGAAKCGSLNNSQHATKTRSFHLPALDGSASYCTYLRFVESVGIHGWQEEDVGGVEEAADAVVVLAVFLNQVGDGAQ